MDEMSLYNRALSSNEIAAIFAAGSAGKCTSSLSPQFTSEPQSQSLAVGGSVVFSATVTGSPPLYYQWRKNGVNVAGATTSTLSLKHVQFSDVGNYDVVASNAWGSVISAPPAVLTVRPLTWEFAGTPALGAGVALADVWARSPGEAYALGEKQRSRSVDIPDAHLYAWDGSSWTLRNTFPGHHAGKVFGTGTNQLWVTLSRCTLGPQAGCGSDQGGKIYRSVDQGSNWVEQVLPPEVAGQEFGSVSGTAGNVHLLVKGGTIVRFDGTSWTTIFNDSVEAVNALTVLSADEGYYVTCWGCEYGPGELDLCANQQPLDGYCPL
jgi:Ig-like domain-containing protein